MPGGRIGAQRGEPEADGGANEDARRRNWRDLTAEERRAIREKYEPDGRWRNGARRRLARTAGCGPAEGRRNCVRQWRRREDVVVGVATCEDLGGCVGRRVGGQGDRGSRVTGWFVYSCPRRRAAVQQPCHQLAIAIFPSRADAKSAAACAGLLAAEHEIWVATIITIYDRFCD